VTRIVWSGGTPSRPKERLLAEIMQRDQKLRLDAMGMKAKFTVHFMHNLSKNLTARFRDEDP